MVRVTSVPDKTAVPETVASDGGGGGIAGGGGGWEAEMHLALGTLYMLQIMRVGVSPEHTPDVGATALLSQPGSSG